MDWGMSGDLRSIVEDDARDHLDEHVGRWRCANGAIALKRGKVARRETFPNEGMPMSKGTAGRAKGIFGTGLYQQRAQVVLPLLVRQARLGRTITYGQLAAEAGIPGGRRTNFPLGSIGRTLKDLEGRLGPIPQLQALAVNARTGLPGSGIDPFFGKALEKARGEERAVLLNAALSKVYAYPKWDKVLAHLNLSPAPDAVGEVVERARTMRGKGGEQEGHRWLKLAIAAQPQLVFATGRAEVEYRLPSGDCVDVAIRTPERLVLVEVKPLGAPVADVVRGVFQAVKYHAVARAYLAVTGSFETVRVVLALGGALPAEAAVLSRALGINVIEGLAARVPANT
jgi:hypothetical protein